MQEYLQNGSIQPNFIAKEQLNFVQSGLQDISISREKSRLPWGVPVPGDHKQVMYVWFEALLNYFTAIINPQTIDTLIEFPDQLDLHIEQLWKDIQDAMPINFMYISKEIAKFHLVIFIGVLKALNLPLPQRSLAHGLINDKDGIKFSKTLNNGVVPQQMVDLFGVDGTRFLILHEINIDGDTNFNWDNMIESYNSHLANNIGNLVMRVTTLISKNFDGLIDLGEVIEEDKLYDFSLCYNYLDDLNPKKSLDHLLEGAHKGNEYLEATKPWKLIKDRQPEKAKQILTQLSVLIKELSEVISIFMPATGDSIYQTITADVIEKAQPLFAKVEKIEK
ncbi:MAG: class I tRNA ligase family protein [Thermales bacterium]|nr:class I tRNA ligase family protein [Thermales bacterium]